jgi:hypothetical protein
MARPRSLWYMPDPMESRSILERPVWVSVAVACLALLVASPADAHHPLLSSFVSQVTLEKVDVFFELDAVTATKVWKLDTDGNNIIDAGEFTAGRADVLAYLDGKFSLSNREQPCVRGDVERYEASENLDKFRILTSYTCPGPPGAIRYDHALFLETTEGHQHVGRLQVGENVVTHVFERGASAYVLDASILAPRAATAAATPAPSAPETQWGSVFVTFLWQGVLHILIGIDHILFVVVLLLVVRRFKQLALIVTSFTLAHSITLALGALDIVTLPSALVESVIALSIVYVAVENMILEEPRARYVVTFVFGLIHGFGFSSVLREVGLPQDALVPALLAFNIGVELGQLAIVAPIFPLVVLLRRKSARAHRWMVWILSGLVTIVAVVWFIERAFSVSILPAGG